MITMAQFLKKGFEEGEGFGLFGHGVRRAESWVDAIDPHEAAKLVDVVTVRLANDRGWTLQQLFDFANSKCGRWAGDGINTGYTRTADIAASINRTLLREMARFEKEPK